MPLNEEQIKEIIRGELAFLLKSDRFTFEKLIQILDGRNIQLGKTTGTKIGTETAQKIGFFNTTPVDQPAALTAQLTTITHAEPGTPDYALQQLTQTTPYGFVTQDEGNSVLKVIANLQTRLAEVEARLEETGLIAAN